MTAEEAKKKPQNIYCSSPDCKKSDKVQECPQTNISVLRLHQCLIVHHKSWYIQCGFVINLNYCELIRLSRMLH